MSTWQWFVLVLTSWVIVFIFGFVAGETNADARHYHNLPRVSWWERFLCWIGYHGESEPCDSFTHIPSMRCLRCKREYEL